MKWSDIQFDPPSKMLRQFAGAWLVFFLAVAAWQGLGRGHPQVGLVLATLAVVVGVLGLLKPAAVRLVYVLWMVLAFPIGWLISLLALGLVFYGIFTPVGLFFRLKGRDLMHRRRASDRPTYWSPKPTPPDVRSYFHPF
jgi:hypothetical protein